MEHTTTVSSDKPDFDSVWLMFQETRKLLEQISLDTDRKFQETNLQFKETDKKFKETERIMKNLMTKSSEYDSRWGKFVESLVEGALIKLLEGREIYVNDTLTRRKKFFNGRQYEIDIIAKNGKDVVVVEVKTTLSSNDVARFIEVLTVFKEVFTDYNNNNIIGAVAYIGVDKDADTFAERQGLFVIKATGESTRITNKKGFEPKAW